MGVYLDSTDIGFFIPQVRVGKAL